MIDKCLKLICDRLNQHLQAQFSVADEMVVLSPLVDAQGGQAAETRNRVAMFLLNIAHDTMPRQRHPGPPAEMRMAPPMHLDLYFMLAAAHDPELYLEGVKQISAAMMYFQANRVLTPRETHELPAKIGQLTVDMINLRVEEVSQLWSNLGGRYVPSVTYKMRTALLDSETLVGIAPVITNQSGRAVPARTP